MNIKENSRILKLSYIFNNYEKEIRDAQKNGTDIGKFLDEIFKFMPAFLEAKASITIFDLSISIGNLSTCNSPFSI